ncbi:hypothetical protein [Silanimonas sp.]|uniref:hypothetical protein n=1 Tax=Silanimonas sp. TaxID=1929290 RepID=UPI0022C79742|nr:hypothetical protein [Silanimonas sp.]MCZ8164974.1 hypothetical protein [Silanimonas sp.]
MHKALRTVRKFVEREPWQASFSPRGGVKEWDDALLDEVDERRFWPEDLHHLER